MKYIILLLCLLVPFGSYAQSQKDLLKKGNNLYKDKKYNDAEVQYRKSLEKNEDPKLAERANFNLGDALYKQNMYQQAEQKFSDAAINSSNPDVKANAFFNLGNTYLKQKNYEKSIEAYKYALKMKPKDMDTKYNLEYAKRMLYQQQQQQQQKQQNKNDKQDKKEQQQQQKQQQQDKQKQQQQKQEQQQEQKISKKDAERMLNALNDEEKKLQKDLKKKVRSSDVNIEKKW